MSDHEENKTMLATIDHACEVGGNGYFLQSLLKFLREDHRLVTSLLTGDVIGKKALVKSVNKLEGRIVELERLVDDTADALERANQVIAEKDKEIDSLLEA